MTVTVNRFLLGWAVIATIIVVILLNVKSCGSGTTVKASGADTVKIIDTITITKEIPVYRPSVVTVTLPSQKEIDTIRYTDSSYCKALAIDYYSRKEYLDTIKGDSIDLILKASVSQNKVDSVKPTLNIRIPYVKTVVQPIPKTAWKFYVGGSVGTTGTGFIGGVNLTLTDRNHMLYQAGAYLSTLSGPVYMVGVGYKIHIGKK